MALSSQQEANLLLRRWQANRKLPPEQRLNDNRSEADLDADLAVIRAVIERRS